MDIGELAENVVSDLMKGFPDPIPSLITVSGGKENVRAAIAEVLYEKTGSKVLDSVGRGYSISLSYFIRKYDSNLC